LAGGGSVTTRGARTAAGNAADPSFKRLARYDGTTTKKSELSPLGMAKKLREGDAFGLVGAD
jgi:hypothetical protein